MRGEDRRREETRQHETRGEKRRYQRGCGETCLQRASNNKSISGRRPGDHNYPNENVRLESNSWKSSYLLHLKIGSVVRQLSRIIVE
jgi:hypothetical protein